MNKTKYSIDRRYINKRPNVRPGDRLKTGSPAFFVAHDTGNPGADAEAHYKYFNRQTDRDASAQVFIDDQRILEIIPTGTGTHPAERAHHVIRNVTTDNERFGYDANYAALGVELCYGTSRAGRTISFSEAYKRFVWYLAYCCEKWNKNPSTHIASHKQLDPGRKNDCEQALASGGKTLKNLITDVAAEMATPINVPDFVQLPTVVAQYLIDTYISPAWFASQQAGDEIGKKHYHNLANNLRMAAGIPLIPGHPAAPITKLHKSNAQEIIFNWLSPGWFKARADGNTALANQFNAYANHLRRAAGIPVE
ncbi:peptidoglycan recognition protein family protein [Paenibacillus brevis]|uniref:peptidoglycan recognition protein family protein n=1 Tax=Paenibacillus brevis TaxID=2841508 RepID=UPI00201AB866|nr:N-acetylmuramoyl-L-alanine amidase [Paenibacillus brevis]